jgi:hypothetical protein
MTSHLTQSPLLSLDSYRRALEYLLTDYIGDNPNTDKSRLAAKIDELVRNGVGDENLFNEALASHDTNLFMPFIRQDPQRYLPQVENFLNADVEDRDVPFDDNLRRIFTYYRNV